MTDAPNTTRLTFHCAMSGEREALTVRAVAPGGMSFIYGDDLSVIVDGDDLVRLRDAITAQIERTAAP